MKALHQLAPIVAMAALATFVCASARADEAPKSTNQCLLVRNISNFNAPDNSTLYIRVGANQIFRMDMWKPCLGLTFRQSVTVKATGASSWICSPLAAMVMYGGSIPQRCPVHAIHKLTPEEANALPKGVKP